MSFDMICIFPAKACTIVRPTDCVNLFACSAYRLNPLCDACLSVQERQSSCLNQLSPTSFYDLCKIPHRDRTASKRRRQSPTFNLTSDEHFDFIRNKKQKITSKKAKKSGQKQRKGIEKENGHGKEQKENKDKNNKLAEKQRGENGKGVPRKRKWVKCSQKNVPDEMWVCQACKGIWGSDNDNKYKEYWYRCKECANQYHDTCAQEHGIIEDGDIFVCMDCC